MITTSIETEFASAMLDAGITPPASLIADGGIYRFKGPGDKGGGLSGWYLLHADNPASGAFGDWREGGEFHKWCSVQSESLTPEERRRCNDRIAEAKRLRDVELAATREKAASSACLVWDNADEADPEHAYLATKHVCAHGLRQKDEVLIVPVRDIGGKLHGLQSINTEGVKRFTSGTHKSEHFHTIGELRDAEKVLVCEGYATAATLHQATDHPAVIAFDCGNLAPVARVIHEAHPEARIVLCADNDRRTPGNPGLTKARDAAAAVGGDAVYPEFADGEEGSDFNDLAALHGLDAVREIVNRPEAWPAVIDIEKPDLPKLREDILPGWAGDFARAVTANAETPFELAAALVMATASTACARRLKVEVSSGHREPSNLWIVAALAPGNRKSSVQSLTVKPLMNWEARQAEILRPAILETESEIKTTRARVEDLRKRAAKSKNPEEYSRLSGEIAQLEADMPEPITPPVLLTTDSTQERLGVLLAQHGERMAWLSSEGGLFDILAGRYSKGANLDLVLKAHSGDFDRADRMTRGSVILKCPLLTVGLSPQPAMLHGLTEQPGFRGRGLLARFLYLLPDSPLGFRTLITPPMPETVEYAYCAGINSMLEWPEADGEDPRYTLKLSSDAREEWLAFALAMEAEMAPGGRWEHASDWGGKAPGAAARVAAVLHGIAHAHGEPWLTPISANTMINALEFMAVVAEHTLAALGLMGADPEVVKAHAVLGWIRRGGHKSFSVRDCYQATKGTIRRAKDLRVTLEFLGERGYVRVFDTKPDGVGRPPSETVEVNPAVLGAPL